MDNPFAELAYSAVCQMPDYVRYGNQPAEITFSTDACLGLAKVFGGMMEARKSSGNAAVGLAYGSLALEFSNAITRGSSSAKLVEVKLPRGVWAMLSHDLHWLLNQAGETDPRLKDLLSQAYTKFLGVAEQRMVYQTIDWSASAPAKKSWWKLWS